MKQEKYLDADTKIGPNPIIERIKELEKEVSQLKIDLSIIQAYVTPIGGGPIG